MRKHLLLLLGLFSWISLAHTREEVGAAERDSLSAIEEEVGLIPESLDANVDSLLHSWHVRYFSKKDDFCHDDEENVFFPDSVYIDRLAKLPRVIELPYNNVVRDCIDLYAERKRGLVR